MSTKTLPVAERELRPALISALPASIGRVVGGDERRSSFAMSAIETRDGGQNGDGSFTFTGTAAVFDTETTLYAGKFWTLKERIAPGAFANVLRQAGLDVHLNDTHDMKSVFARLTSVGEAGAVPIGGMKLWEDAAGLRVFARLDARKSSVQDLAIDMEERPHPDGGTFRVVDQMSFAFRIGRESLTTIVEDDHETDLWTIEEISELYDVCVCAQGAYSTTSAALRSAVRDLGHAGVDPAGLRPRHGENPPGDSEVTRADLAGSPTSAEVAERQRQAELRARERERARCLYPLED